MPFNSAQVNSILAQKLTMAANYFAETMKKKISEVRAPSVIAQHISIGKAQKENGSYSIDITIDTSKDAAPMARAYEWGSGLHATRGEKDTYLIEPDKAEKLAIPRSRWPKYQPPPDKDPVILQWVYHPGVAPRPYIVPSIEESKEEIKRMLGQSFKAAVMIGVEKVTIIHA